MKKLFYALAIVLVVACKNEAPKDYVLISGNILNIEKDEVKIRELNGAFSKTLKLSEDGSFTDTLRINEGNYMIHDNKNFFYVYLEMGNDLHLTYDYNDYNKTMKFSGNGAEINNYFVQKKDKEREIKGDITNIFELNESDFKAKQEEIKLGLLELISTNTDISKTNKEKEVRNINYSYLYWLSNYEGNHAYYTKNPDFKISEGYLKELEDLPLDNEEDFKYSSSYRNLIIEHINEEAKKLSKTDSIENDVAFLVVLKKLPNDNIKNELYYNKAKYGITYTSDLENYYDAFMSGSTNEDHKKEITESYNVLKTVAKGQSSPKFVNYENNLGGTTSLDDLKGKYIYIDVWATWCGPCKAEIPYLKKIEEQYHGKNIEFVSISVDKAKDHDKWKKMIVDEELSGIQLIANNDFESEFIKEYLIKGIPRFILIDPNGKIVNSNAPRPSDDKLINLFNELNI